MTYFVTNKYRCFYKDRFPDDTRIRTNEDQTLKRTAIYLLDHTVPAVTLWCSPQRFSPSPFFMSILYTLSIIDFFTNIDFFMRIVLFFSGNTRIGTSEDQYHRRAVYLLEDHKVTMFFSALLTVSFFYEHSIDAFL